MIVDTQIRLRIDALSSWTQESSKPLHLGEVGIAYELVNIAPEGQPADYQSRNFQARVGRTIEGTHWLSSAPIQADEFTQAFYQQLTSQLSSVFVLSTDFNNAVAGLNDRTTALEQSCLVPEVSGEVLQWKLAIQPEP